jgi:hypothetical protein
VGVRGDGGVQLMKSELGRWMRWLLDLDALEDVGGLESSLHKRNWKVQVGATCLLHGPAGKRGSSFALLPWQAFGPIRHP